MQASAISTNGCCGARQRLLDDLRDLFDVALTEFAARPHHLADGPAFALVLHTWTQDLRRHGPVHALVAGGALSVSSARLWPKKGFLFPVRALSRVFRGQVVAGLAQWASSACWPSHAEWARLNSQCFKRIRH